MNPKELEVLKLLLRSDKPLSLPDLLSIAPSMVKSTTAAALAKLLKEGCIEVAGIGHSGKVICRNYRPAESAKKLLLDDFIKSYNSISDIISKTDVCLTLLSDGKNPKAAEKEPAQLRAMLEQYEKECGAADGE